MIENGSAFGSMFGTEVWNSFSNLSASTNLFFSFLLQMHSYNGFFFFLIEVHGKCLTFPGIFSMLQESKNFPKAQNTGV